MPELLQPMTRRTVLAALGATAGIYALSAAGANAVASTGRLKQSVCRWTYGRTPLPDFCRRIKQIGFSAIDLLFVDEWPEARDAGLTVSMGYPSRRDKFIATGFNDPANHPLLLQELESVLPLAASARVPNVIAMFGNRLPGVDFASDEYDLVGTDSLHIFDLDEIRGQFLECSAGDGDDLTTRAIIQTACTNQCRRWF